MASRGDKNIICNLRKSNGCLTLSSAIQNVNASAVELDQKSSKFQVSIAGAISSSMVHSYYEPGNDLRKSFFNSKIKNILVLIVILGFYLRSVSSIQMVAQEHDYFNSKVNNTSIHSFVLIDKDGDVYLKKKALERHSYNVDPLGRLNVVPPLQLTIESHNGSKSSAGVKFTQDIYECTISEGSLPRTYLITAEMMGIFFPSPFTSSGISNRFTGAHFQIIEGDEGGVFKVESKLVGDFIFLRIRTRSTAYINREQKNRYNLTIGAKLKYFSKLGGKISGNSQNIIPAKHALDAYDIFTNVIVTVLDSNDLGPVFDKSEYFAVISDHAPLHFEIIRVVASDSDLGINSDVYYQLDNKSRSYFAIHPNLGMVMLLKHAQDLESDYYELEITARDRGLQGHGRIGHTKVKVKVLPENKDAPFISILHQTVGLNRNINAQTALAYLKISDLDLGKNGEITSVIIKGNYKEDFFELLNIDDNSTAFTENKGSEFILHAKDSVYIEKHKKELIFSIMATDGGMPPKSSSLEIKFSLENDFKFPTNVSRMAIAFQASQFSIMKCHPIGTLIGYVNNSQVTSNSVRFKPVRCAKVVNATDKECSAKGDYSLQIKCHCHESLTHLNQMKTGFETYGTKDDVDSSSTFDPFEFVSVHEITGNIKISKSFRNLPTNVNKLHILIQMEYSEFKDSPPSLYSVLVRIDNCNDHGPVFDEPLQDQIVVKEDVSTKTVILWAHATDEDIGNGATIIAYSIFNAYINMFTNTSLGEGFDSSNDIDSILDDNPMSDNTSIFPFVIDHLSGEVFTTSPLDFDSGPQFYELYLRASDAGTPFPRHTDARPIRIIISDVNDNPPVFNLQKISCFIARNVVVGTLITFVRASDIDTVGGPITYQMTSISNDRNLKIDLLDNVNTNCFSLDGMSGHLILTCDLKEITGDWFHFQVVASDGLHNSSEHLIIELKVVESRMPRYDGLVNKTTNVSDIACEESPKLTKGDDRFFHKKKYVLKGAFRKPPRHSKRMNQPPTIHAHQPFHVRENSARGTVFGKIEAYDPDIGYNGLLQFSILQENPSDDNVHLKGWELFDVDVHSGLLKVAAYLDRELLFGDISYQSKEKTFSEIFPSEINQYLNNKSYIGSLQSSYNESPARSISFNIVVRVCDMAKTPLCSEKMFTIILDDVNDNHPEFDKSLYRTKVKEDVGIGHFVLRIHAMDRDCGINGEITYSIEGSNYFSIHPINGEIRVALNLDREFKDKHEFKVVAKDSSNDNPFSSEVAVVVVVMDVNDNKPQFLKEMFKFQILEDLPLGSVVGVIHANDPDEGNGGKILYQLLDTLSSPGDEVMTSHPFSIDSTSGAIILDGNLLNGHIYNIRAKATDKGRPPLSSDEGLVQIWIVPINRNHHEPVFKDFVRECSVRENQPAGSSVVQLQAFDQDSLNSLSPQANYKVEYSVRSGTGLGFFIIDSRGIVQTSQPLDRELASSYWLTIYAQDSAIPSKGSSMHLFIRVLDENDNHPLFRQPVYRFSVAENSPPRTWVGQVEAFDADLPSKMGLTFHLLDKSSKFTIDKKTGVVRTTAEHLDREMKAEHRIEVLAKDNSEDQSLSSTTLIIITIIDQNDCPPRFFDSPHLEILLPVLSSADSTHHHRHHYQGHHIPRTLYEGLLVVQAYDMDSGLNGNVEYSLDIHPDDSPMYRDEDDDLNGVGSPNFPPFQLLRIHPKSGSLKVLRTLKNDERIYAQVKAKDKGEPSLHSAIKITIRGVDIKDSRGHGSLRFIDDSCGKVHILEDSPPFDMVCLAVAKYVGGGDIGRESGHIWYYISAGNDAGNFGINWKVGSLRLLRKLVWTSAHTLNLTITATDGFTVVNMMSLIHIVDSNNHDPKFENSKYHFNITWSSELNQNFSKSIKIGEVKATDEDDYDDGRLFYGILGFTHSHDHNLFSIDPDSGSISLNLEPNHNVVHGCHTFTVEAKNRPSTLRPIRQDYAHVMVCLINNDLVNRAPEFTSNKYYGEVGWWKGVGDEVLKVKAVDEGLGLNGKVRYSLVSGNEYKLFSLDSYTGSLSLFSPISQRHVTPLQALLKDGFITMRVKATDFGSPKLSSFCLVQIKLSNFLESHDLKFDVRAPEFEISENVRLGSYVGHLTNTPSGIGVLYSLECVAEYDDNYIERTNHVISYQLPNDDDDDPDKNNDECMFAIDTFSGVLTTLKSLDREVKDRHFLKVTASVIGGQASFNLLPSSLQGKIQTLAVIKVKDENDVRPQFRHSVYNGWLSESSKPSQYILLNVKGRRANQPILFEAVDLDVGKNAVIGFRIVEGWANKLFEIISSESSIKSKTLLDREAILMFQYIYGGGIDSFEPDEFDNLKSSDSIMSYCAKGINNKSTQSLLLDKPTGSTVPCHNSHLPINWPSYAKLKFHVESFDYGVPQLSSLAEVVIEVHDINDSPPQFFGGSHDEVIIWPPLVPGFRVFKVKAFDLDFKGSKLKYNLDADAMHPPDTKYFHLDESTGWLSVTNELCDDHAFCLLEETEFFGYNNLKWIKMDEERHHNFTFALKVKVTDGRFQSSMAIVIKIIDPGFIPTTMTKVLKDYDRFQYRDLIYKAEVLENTREIQLLTRLKIVSESLTFSLLNHDDLFTVYSHSGIVETKGDLAFDREATDKYDILIDAKDHLLAHVTRFLVKVKVKDVNDNTPMFFGLPYIVVVDVNTSVGAVLFQPIVKDFDLGSNSELSFSLVHGNASIFVVDKTSGQILLNGQVVNLIGQKFSIMIKAEDGGVPSLSSEAEVTFYFKGDTHPYFNPPVVEMSVNLDHPPFIGFAYVTANSYRGARIVYTIDDEDGGVDGRNGRIPQLQYFDVDLDSGSLLLLRDISLMMGQSISLVVRATDVNTGFHGDLRAVIRIVGNIREVPVFDKISYKIFVTPFLQEGQVILEPNFTNRRVGDSNLEFKLTPSQYRPRFSYNGRSSVSVDFKKIITIDQKIGLIKVGKVMDFKQLCSAGHADFVISARDSSDSTLTSSAAITILPFNGGSFKIYFNSKIYETKLKIPSLRSNENITKLKSLETSIMKVSASVLGNCDCIEGNNSQMVFYSLVGDTSSYLLNHNKLLQFSIGRNTGTIEAAIVSVKSSSKEATVLPIIILNVTASSIFGSVDFARVRVKIEMETLEGPRFSSSLYFLNLNSSLPPGNIVLTTRFVDHNLSDDFRLLNYEIESDDDRIANVFQIDSKGQVYMKEGLIGLRRNQFQFYIKVTDQNGFTGESKVKVDISNDYHLQKIPAFIQTAYVVNVNVGAYVGTTVFKIETPSIPPEALEMDHEKIRFNMLPEDCLHENGVEYFYFVDGSLRVARTLTHLGNYSFKCYAKAFNSVGQSNPVQITINVVSNNFDGPTYGSLVWTNQQPSPTRDASNFYDQLEFELDYYVFHIAENLEPGYHVGRVGLTNGFTEGRIVFTLKGWAHDNKLENINDFFLLNKNTGILTSATSFDFELSQTFDFLVIAYDSYDKMDPLEVQVRVNIINLNDNDPIFIKPEEHKVSLREDANVGLILMKLSTLDPDNSSRPFLFIKQGDPCGRFDLSPLGELTLKKSLDREIVQKYKLDVVASDGWKMAQTTVEVDVLNANDNSPICRDIPYQISLMENATVGINILQINVTDPDDDAGNKSSLTHVIEPMKNVERRDNYIHDSTDLFSVDRVTGIISLKGSLDRETNPKHDFWVRSSDQGGHFCRSKVEVTVEDVDDNPPRFLKPHYEGKVEENGRLGVAVMKVIAFDPDEERNALFHYYLTDHQLPSRRPSSSSSSSSLLSIFSSSSLYFSIHQQTGLITTKMSFDREKQNLYNLTAFVVSVTSYEQPEEISSVRQWSSANISITISDVNDNPPVFTHSIYTFTVSENTTVGTTIGLVKAVSIDEGLNALVTYAILNFDPEEAMEKYLDLSEYGEGSCGSKQCRNGIITVDSRTGHLTLRDSLDYEKVKIYHFMVMAYDSGIPPLSSITKVAVIIEDVNDNAPLMLQEQYQLEVYENNTVGEKLMQISALDKDSGLNAMLRFKIATGNDGETFHMDEATGILSLQKPLDREEVAFWILRIDCFDLGTPPLTGHSSIQVTVFDVNDCTPQLSADSLKGLNISEQMKPGKFLRKLVIEDCDEIPNSFPFKYEIMHVGYDAHMWVENCRNYSHTTAGNITTLKSAENIFFIDTEGRLYSTNKTVPYLKNIGLFVKNKNRTDHEKVMVLIKITDNGDISLSSCSSIPISLFAPPWKFPHSEEISIISFSLEPLKVLLNLYPKLGRNRFESDNDLTWPTGKLCQVKAIAKVVRSNSTFILNDSSEHWKEFDVRYWISTTEYDDIKKEAHKNRIHQIFWMNQKSGAIHSRIPLDPGTYKFLTTATLKFNNNGDDDDAEGLIKKEHKTELMVTVAVEVLSESMLDEAVAVKFSNNIDQKTNGDEDDFKNYNATLPSSSLPLVTHLASSLIDVLKQRKGLNTKILGVGFKLRDDEKPRRLKRSTGTSSSPLKWVEFLISATNSDHGFGHLNRTELHNILHKSKSHLEESTGLNVVSIAFSGNSQAPLSCDKKESKDCIDKKCDVTFAIDTNSSVPVKLLDSSHLQIVPKFFKKVFCLCPDGGRTNENGSCRFMKDNLNDYKPEKGAGDDDDDIADVTNVHASMTFNGQSYFAWHAAIPLERKLFISFDIRTNQTRARLLHLAGHMDYSFLEIESGYLQFLWNFGSGPGKVRIQGQKVSDGRWHHVTLERSGLNVRLILDSSMVLDAVALGNSDVLNLEDNKIIFGGEVNYIDHAHMDVRFGFIGCMRNIKLNGVELFLTRSSSVQGYLVNTGNIHYGCDVEIFTGVCSSRPCLNGGSCMSVDQKSFICDCSKAFQGKFCEKPIFPHRPTNPCLSSSPNPCLNSGTCKPMNGMHYKCSCTEGYHGVHCEILSSMPIKEKGIGDIGQERSLLPSQNFQLLHVIIVVMIVTASITVGLVVLIVCLCRISKKKKQEGASFNSDSNDQNKLNNLIANLQLKREDLKVNPDLSIYKSVNSSSKDRRNVNNCNNSNNHFNFFGRDFQEELKNDNLELEPLKGHLSPDHGSKQSFSAEYHSNDSLSLKKNGFDGNTSESSRTRETFKGSKHCLASSFVGPRNFSSTNPIAFNLCQLDKRTTMSENVNINQGSSVRSLVPLKLKMVKGVKGLSQLSTPAKLHLGSVEKCPETLDIFSTKQSLEWDSRDLKPDMRSHHFKSSSGLISECEGREKLFCTTSESEPSEILQTNELGASTDNDLPLLVKSGRAISKADPSLYQTTFISKSDDQ